MNARLITTCVVCMEPLYGTVSTVVWRPREGNPVTAYICQRCAAPRTRADKLKLIYAPPRNIRLLLAD